MYIDRALNNKFITNIRITNSNEKMFVKRYDVRKSQRFNFDSSNYEIKKILWLLIVDVCVIAKKRFCK